MFNFLVTETIFSKIGNDPAYIFEFIMILVALIGLTVLACFLFRKLFVRITYIVLAVLFFLFYILAVETGTYVTFGIFILLSIICCQVNAGMISKFFANTKPGLFNKNHNTSDYDIDEFINKVCQTVKTLSESKTGAILVFEGSQSLDQYASNGTIINAPFVPELVQTIFYEGTRLHDGAIIIRDNIILAAAVFLPSTKKILTGKNGARHRAALGISEHTDALTILVSEETGKIQITYNSEATSTLSDEFPNIFRQMYIEARQGRKN